MAKANITQYSSTPSSNTDINNIDIDENCPASGLNNAIRELMAHLKNVDTGSQALTALSVTGDLTVDTNTLYVDSANNNVGIGTSSPVGILDILSNDNGLVFQTSSSSNKRVQVFFKDNGGTNTARIGNDISADNTSQLQFIAGSGSTPQVTLSSDGTLFVGMSVLSGLGTNVTGSAFTTGGPAYFARSTNGNILLFYSGSGLAGRISVSGSSTAYNTSSDHRLKENVTADWDGTTRLKQLNPVRFNFIEDADTTVDGFLAHEVQSVVPEAITGTHNEVEVWQDGEELPDGVSVGDNKLDEDGNAIPVYQGIDQSKLVPLLVKTIQELEARITALENA